MKRYLLLAVLLTLFGISSAQDTIFVKTGEIIPAVIVEKNSTEIKYKKPGKNESVAIYSIFTSDVASIHFKDGLIADYTAMGQNATHVQGKPIDFANTMKVIRIGVGFEGQYFKRTMNDELLTFWRYYTGKPGAMIGGNPVSIPIQLKMGFVIGNSGRNWLGDELQMIITPADAIHASEYNNSYEIKLKNFYYNIILFYGHTLNHKRTVAAIFEPGLDVIFMNGYFKFSGTEYKEIGTIAMGFHGAVGLDWVLAKRLTLSARAGYKLAKFKEQHENGSGAQSWYSIPVADQKDLRIPVNGAYASFGICYNFYIKMKGMKLE